MNDTLSEGDYIVINKLSYLMRTPERFDVIVFPYDKEGNIYYIKRIIGLPGEKVQIINSSIYINGTLLYEDYGKESIDEYTEGIAKDGIVLSQDEFFVLGDNRNNSIDSRNNLVGPVKRSDILGKAIFSIYPFSSFGSIRG